MASTLRFLSAKVVADHLVPREDARSPKSRIELLELRIAAIEKATLASPTPLDCKTILRAAEIEWLPALYRREDPPLMPAEVESIFQQIYLGSASFNGAIATSREAVFKLLTLSAENNHIELLGSLNWISPPPPHSLSPHPISFLTVDELARVLGIASKRGHEKWIKVFFTILPTDTKRALFQNRIFVMHIVDHHGKTTEKAIALIKLFLSELGVASDKHEMITAATISDGRPINAINCAANRNNAHLIRYLTALLPEEMQHAFLMFPCTVENNRTSNSLFHAHSPEVVRAILEPLTPEERLAMITAIWTRRSYQPQRIVPVTYQIVAGGIVLERIPAYQHMDTPTRRATFEYLPEGHPLKTQSCSIQ